MKAASASASSVHSQAEVWHSICWLSRYVRLGDFGDRYATLVWVMSTEDVRIICASRFIPSMYRNAMTHVRVRYQSNRTPRALRAFVFSDSRFPFRLSFVPARNFIHSFFRAPESGGCLLYTTSSERRADPGGRHKCYMTFTIGPPRMALSVRILEKDLTVPAAKLCEFQTLTHVRSPA